jgi:hypothetical protein
VAGIVVKYFWMHYLNEKASVRNSLIEKQKENKTAGFT